jgi:hypothetical protein
MKKMLLFIAIIAIFCSCKKNENISEFKNPSNEKYDVLVYEQEDPTSELDLEVIIDEAIIQKIVENKSLGPIATLWRKNSGCKKLGICKWFPKEHEDILLKGREVILPLIYNVDSESIEPIKLAFTSSAKFLSEEDIQFYVDEDFEIEVTNEMNLPFKRVRIPNGVIEFNSTIGSYGGYVINIVGINN